jgi:hypothetical protein
VVVLDGLLGSVFPFCAGPGVSTSAQTWPVRKYENVVVPGIIK